MIKIGGLLFVIKATSLFLSGTPFGTSGNAGAKNTSGKWRTNINAHLQVTTRTTSWGGTTCRVVGSPFVSVSIWPLPLLQRLFLNRSSLLLGSGRSIISGSTGLPWWRTSTIIALISSIAETRKKTNIRYQVFMSSPTFFHGFRFVYFRYCGVGWNNWIGGP